MNQIEFLSLGLGVQSSTLALMIAKRPASEHPKAAIFSDTEGEPGSVYAWRDWLAGLLPFPLIQVSAGNLAEKACVVRISKKSGAAYTNHNIPVFIKSPIPGEREGLQSRQCTQDFKLEPIEKQVRLMCKDRIRHWHSAKRSLRKYLDNDDEFTHIWSQVKPPVRMLIGISRDEAIRMKPSRLDYIQNAWPLIDLGMTRSDCVRWMQDHGFPKPPRSACVYCPYHNDAEWLRLKNEEPQEFERAVTFEKNYQTALAKIPRIKGIPFLHRSCLPLDSIDFKPDGKQPELFGQDCLGLCGV